MDTFQRMKVFARVAEAGGFTAAAARLDLATGQVSRAVSELEQHLRTRLFNRTTRRVVLTEAGEHTDPFTLQYVAGHDNIKTTMRYVHPRQDAVERLLARLGSLPKPEMQMHCAGSAQNRVQSELASDTDLAKLLSALGLQCAEVVELADTPS